MVAFQVPLPETMSEEQVSLLGDQIREHFTGILCADHLRALELHLVRSASELVCRLQPCCAAVRQQVVTHLPCAEEMAAIHGLQVICLPAA